MDTIQSKFNTMTQSGHKLDNCTHLERVESRRDDSLKIELSREFQSCTHKTI